MGPTCGCPPWGVGYYTPLMTMQKKLKKNLKKFLKKFNLILADLSPIYYPK
jgi:hypothetical protein